MIVESKSLIRQAMRALLESLAQEMKDATEEQRDDAIEEIAQDMARVHKVLDALSHDRHHRYELKGLPL